MSHLVPISVIVSAMLATTLTIPTADAATQNRRTFDAAVGVCQGALPNFEGSLRKRPMAVANEGISTAFVSCAPHMSTIFSVGGATNPGADHVWILFRNRTGAPTTANCSLVTSDGLGVADITIAKSVAVPAGSWVEMQWNATADNGGINFRLPAFSCSLPPGTDIGHVIYNHTVDVGA